MPDLQDMVGLADAALLEQRARKAQIASTQNYLPALEHNSVASKDDRHSMALLVARVVQVVPVVAQERHYLSFAVGYLVASQA